MPVTDRRDSVEGADAEASRALWDRAATSDGVAPVSEAFALALGPGHAGVVHLLRLDDEGTLVGYAQVADAGTPDAAAELVVDPAARRRGHGRALLDAALDAGARAVWAHGDLDAARALASSAGLEPTRSLHLMARPLGRDDETDPDLPDGYTVRPFEPGRDDEDWVRVNAAAFASHPEQGRLTVADLRERIRQPWFDPAGLLLVERDGRVVAFHWTKVEERAGRTGEVYVVGVDPGEQGRGLGGPVTRLGLAHLARLGLDEVRLYVDGDNTPARRTYARLGFEDVGVDVQYSVPR